MCASILHEYLPNTMCAAYISRKVRVVYGGVSFGAIIENTTKWIGIWSSCLLCMCFIYFTYLFFIGQSRILVYTPDSHCPRGREKFIFLLCNDVRINDEVLYAHLWQYVRWLSRRVLNWRLDTTNYPLNLYYRESRCVWEYALKNSELKEWIRLELLE